MCAVAAVDTRPVVVRLRAADAPWAEHLRAQEAAIGYETQFRYAVWLAYGNVWAHKDSILPGQLTPAHLFAKWMRSEWIKFVESKGIERPAWDSGLDTRLWAMCRPASPGDAFDEWLMLGLVGHYYLQAEGVAEEGREPSDSPPPDKPVKHLVFTGPLAGERFCGAPRDSGEGSHLPYTATLSSAFRATITCKECLAVYDDAGREDT